MRYFSERHTLERHSEHAAGYDLHSRYELALYQFRPVLVSTGIYLEIPQGHFGLIEIRSSFAKKGLCRLAGVIDSDYRGEIFVNVVNLSTYILRLEEGERFAQVIIMPHLETAPIRVDNKSDLTVTKRGDNGFGSTSVSGS